MNFDDNGPSGNELWTQMVVDTTNVANHSTKPICKVLFEAYQSNTKRNRTLA